MRRVRKLRSEQAIGVEPPSATSARQQPALGPVRCDRSAPATTRQVRAIAALAERQGLDLPALLEQRLSTTSAADLTAAEAFDLLADLQSSAADLPLER